VTERLAWHQASSVRWSEEEDLLAVAGAGYKLISAWRQKLEDCGAAVFADRARELGLAVSSLSWVGGFMSADRYGILSAIDDALQAVDDATELGAPTLIAVTGQRNGHVWSHARKMLAEYLRGIADVAGASGVQLAVSPIDLRFSRNGDLLQSLQYTLDLLDYCNHSAIGLNLDTFGLPPTPEIWAWIAAATPWIRHVQLREDDTLPPVGQQVVTKRWCDLAPGLLTHLEQHGYTGAYDVLRIAPNFWKTLQPASLDDCMRQFRAAVPVAVPESELSSQNC